MGIWALIKEDFAQPKTQDPAFDSNLELIFNYPGVWAVVNHRVTHALWTRGWRKCARFLGGVSNFLTRVDLHPGAEIGRRVFIDHATGVVVGETAIVGDDCLIYQGVTLGGVSLEKGKRHPTLENGVVVGAGAKILGNITVGKNSKIGANSVVIKDVPAYSTAVGAPARVVRICSKPLEHNKLPDVDKEIFNYLLARIENLETELSNLNNCKHLNNCKQTIKNKDIELDENFKQYLKSFKE